VDEIHGDFVYEVEQDEKGHVRSFRTVINASVDARKKQRVPLRDLPSESLKNAFVSMTGKTRAELGI
jgi:hypothetical protein